MQASAKKYATESAQIPKAHPHSLTRQIYDHSRRDRSGLYQETLGSKPLSDALVSHYRPRQPIARTQPKHLRRFYAVMLGLLSKYRPLHLAFEIHQNAAPYPKSWKWQPRHLLRQCLHQISAKARLGLSGYIFAPQSSSMPGDHNAAYENARSQMTPNGQELSHAAGDIRQPESRSENCQT